MTLPRIAMPIRLSDGTADRRIDVANRIFDDVAALVAAAGGEVVRVDAVDLTGIDGVVLPGGGDVDPARYGGARIDALYDVNPAQDDLDFGWARAARDVGIPILGVCRGLQVLNVLFGGTLVEDLPAGTVEHNDRSDGDRIDWAWHPVTVTDGSLLARHLGGAQVTVASGHHQGIGTVGTGLSATAVAPDGLVEAVESAADAVVAVQWHPEAAGTDPHLALAPFLTLRDLVAAHVRR
ncbi:gamma-glutamyl-gamma-aminobutyrate hydrolase family protein [Microbacterium sp.]|uniref:gamma-glutamyl-gamma-aminobutyrate hydrolase family protein n=1 Tax=Microbacterium sp. TaxID=51671 RepID=UPI003A85DB0D